MMSTQKLSTEQQPRTVAGNTNLQALLAIRNYTMQKLSSPHLAAVCRQVCEVGCDIHDARHHIPEVHRGMLPVVDVIVIKCAIWVEHVPAVLGDALGISRKHLVAKQPGALCILLANTRHRHTASDRI
jgi:hypothetical protein